MEKHKITLPQKVLVGKNIINNIHEICNELKIKKKIVILTGPNVKKLVGEKVYDILNSNGFESELYVVENSSINEAYNICERIKKNPVGAVIGVGGGKVIDITKIVAFKNNIPYISVPTAASHDGISSPIASIKNGKNRTSVLVNPPLSIIADVNIIANAPYRLTASGCGDIIAKFTSVRDWKLAKQRLGEYYGEYAASLALMSANLVVKHARNIRRLMEDSIRTIIEALISCSIAMCIAGSSRPCSGSEHMFSHALDIIAEKPGLHGEQCGIGTIIMMYLHGGNWEKIKNTLSIIRAPTNAKELGVEESDIIKALIKAKEIRKDRYTILNEKEIDWRKAERIAIATGIIKE